MPVKHTPGPWAVSGQSEGGRYITVSAPSRVVARVPWNRATDETITDINDARLIAIAPELLALLRRIMPEIETGGMSEIARRAWLADVRATIAKAE
jgi:hypothetical protein